MPPTSTQLGFEKEHIEMQVAPSLERELQETVGTAKLVESTTRSAEITASSPGAAPGGWQFWLIMISLMVSAILTALDLTAVSTALPVIVEKLHGSDFVWVGAAYSLGSTAFLPLSGGLAQIFGRRPILLGSLALFAAGSAVSASARNMTVLIAGRTLQGVGGGGIWSLTEIIVGDLVPLRLRGPYFGLIAAAWAVATAVGPLIAGTFAQSNWRWLFYMNLPICGVAMGLMFFFLRLKTPRDTFGNRMKRMDWIGNFLVIGSSTSLIIALSWAGVQFSWSSSQCLVPLILGVAGLVAFMIWEAKFAFEPVVPWQLVNNRTSLSGYITVFLQGVASTAAVYFLPVFFQGVSLFDPRRSGLALLPSAVVATPAAVACGLVVAKYNVYKPQNYAGWIFTIIGFGLFSMVGLDSPPAWKIGFQFIGGFGLGINYAAPSFAVLAPIPITETAHAMALFAFVRSLSQSFGITVGSTILQSELQKKLSAAFLEHVGSSPTKGAEIAYSVIPVVAGLPEPLRRQVREAFAESVQVIWRVMIGVSAVGLLCVFGMKEVKMHEVTDEDWGIAEQRSREKEEKGDNGETDMEKTAAG